MAAKKQAKVTKKVFPYVAVRADCGVYCGDLVSSAPTGDGHMTLKLRGCRRIFKWEGFIGVQMVQTVEDIANFGVGPGSQVSSAAIETTIADARMFVACSAKAQENLEAATWKMTS